MSNKEEKAPKIVEFMHDFREKFIGLSFSIREKLHIHSRKVAKTPKKGSVAS